MNYQHFLTDVQQHLRGDLGDDISITVKQITKNNGVIYQGLIITKEGCNISPTIFLNSYYQRYRAGVSIAEICGDIARSYRDKLPKKEFDAGFFLDFSQVRSRIVPKLISYSRNLELLRQIPYTPYLDMAMVFVCLVSTNNAEQATILIRNEHIEGWGTDRMALQELALENGPRLLPAQFDRMDAFLERGSFSCSDVTGMKPGSLEAFLARQAPCTTEFDPRSDQIPEMYLLTNRTRISGAAVIRYPGLLRQLGDAFQRDLVILPSSIHELLLVPLSSGKYSPEELSRFPEIVRDVNRDHVEEEDILSDTAYLYDHKQQEVRIL